MYYIYVCVCEWKRVYIIKSNLTAGSLFADMIIKSSNNACTITTE